MAERVNYSSEAVALARWQGAIDERTKVIERRMDSLNGDVRVIRNDLGEIKQAISVSSDFRASWTGLLTQLRDNAVTASAERERKHRWLEGWRKWLLIAAGVITAVAAVANIFLNSLGT